MSQNKRVKELEQKVEGARPRIVVVWPGVAEPAEAREPGAVVLRVKYVDAKAT